MRNFNKLLLVTVLVLSAASAGRAAPDHSASGVVGAAASFAGAEFVAGARRIAVPLIVVGRTVVDGVAFVLLKGEQGVIWVAEESIYGLKYAVAGARFVLLETARGVRWIALEALAAGEIVLDAALAVTELVIADATYVLIRLEEGFTFVAKQSVAAGRVVIRGVRYLARKTADGVIFVAEATADAIDRGLHWAADKALAAGIRARLAAALTAADVGADSLGYFQTFSVNADASAHLRRLALAAYNCGTAFNAAYRR